jgi:alpha-D-ribose 1-methylphosphonate 5-triphosphate diphosphatase
MRETILANAEIVLPDRVARGSVTLAGGQIVEIAEGAAVRPGVVDCGGDYLAPGLIELHTDNLERHMQPRPGVHWPQRAAVIAHDAELAGTGITTVFDALRVGSVVSDRKSRYGKYARDVLTQILALRRAGQLRISHFVHLRAEICSETLLDELAEFTPEDRIGLVSLMDHTPGQRQFRDLTKLEDYLRGKFSMGAADIAAHFEHLRAIKAEFGAAHEHGAVAHAARLGAVLASHDDTSAEDVEASAAHGVKVAEFPTTEEAALASRANGIAVMMGAPNLLRGGSHSGNVAASVLADQGLLDILSSDYAPAALLMAAVRLGLEHQDLAMGLRSVTTAPADAIGLADRGRIAPGARADLIRFRLSEGLPIVGETWVQGRRVA